MKLFTNYIIKIIFIFIISFWSSQHAKAQNAAVYFQETFSYSDTFVAAIYLDSFNTLGSVTMSIQFDQSEFEILEVIGDPDLGGSFAQNIIQDTILLAWFSLTPLTAPDTLATIKLLKKADFCNSPLDWTGNLQLTDSIAQTIPSTFYNGKAYYLKDEKPTLVFPANNVSNVSVNSIFRWNDFNIECESGYHLQVASDSNFTQLISDTIVVDSVFPVAGLQALTTNYWRVAKVDELGNEYWSDFNTFFTIASDTIKNSIPTVISWSDTVEIPVTFTNSENIGRFNIDIAYDTFTFDYIGYSDLLGSVPGVQVVDSADGVIQVLWETPDYPTVIQSDTMIMLKFVQAEGCIGSIGFLPSTEYYYVENVTIPSTYNDGQVTFADSFTTQLIFPIDSSTDVFIRPELTWEEVHCSNGYQVQVAYDSTFTQLVINTITTDTIFVPDNLTGDTTYYWRIGRFNTLDSLYWSDIWTFSTEPVLAIDVKAHDLATTADTFFIPITIDSLANAISFQLHLDYDINDVAYLGFSDTTTLISNLSIVDNNGTVEIYWESADSSLNTVANIASDTLVQLQFEYLSGCETTLMWDTDTSDFYHINDNINIDATFQNSHLIFLRTEFPTLIAPADSSSTIMYPDFIWENMECVEQFHFQISLDDQFTQIIVDSILTDTSLWITTLQPNTAYHWRVAKEDFVGELFWSDTLTFTTEDLYNINVELDSILTYQLISEVPLKVDSAMFVNGFQMEIIYDDNELNYVDAIDPLFSNITIVDNGGVLNLTWQDTTQWYDLLEDTVLTLRFFNTGACQTPVSWSSVQFDYRGDASLNNPIITKDGSMEFLNTNAPVLITPIANETDIFPLVDFVWSSVDCSVEYQLQVSDDNQFNNILLDTILLNAAYDDLILDHNSTYYWRVGRWDTQNDRYWSDTLTFQTSLLPTINVTASDAITYEDTMQIAITLDSLVWVEDFNLALEYDTLGFEYTGYVDTLFDMIVSEQNGIILIQWSAGVDSISEWLTIDRDTIVYLNFKMIGGCFTDLAWNIATSFTYKTPTIAIPTVTNDGLIEWVNDDVALLTFPPNDTAFMPTSFELTWEAVNCAVNYSIQIATDSTFDNIVIDEVGITDENYLAMGLQNYTQYYWRVGQLDTEDSTHFSEFRTFKTDLLNENDFWIYPNPSNGPIRIWFNQENLTDANINIYNDIGQLMRQFQIDAVGKQIELDLGFLDRGIYLIQYNDGTNQWVEKVMIY